MLSVHITFTDLYRITVIGY